MLLATFPPPENSAETTEFIASCTSQQQQQLADAVLIQTMYPSLPPSLLLLLWVFFASFLKIFALLRTRDLG